ncbi:Fic/DOC family N-terminal domain-containing protein [Ensifer adhaerens]|uniref:Fic/DOC family N-terminal domain-containing protein n=1 Tax=Ensifer adhaerens TaxID=106592 RepID=UPI002AA2A8F4|nr:Fic/DOC family N-terminal domain-containing protein [Ensifer adhaerens]
MRLSLSPECRASLSRTRPVLVNSIRLLEAQASPEIENIVTTTDKLFRFANEPGNQADPATTEALCRRTRRRHKAHGGGLEMHQRSPDRHGCVASMPVPKPIALRRLGPTPLDRR